MTRPLALVVSGLFTLLIAGPAAAQGSIAPSTPSQPPPELPPPSQPAPAPAVAPATGASTKAAPVEEEEKEKGDAPKARTGFQMQLRTGVAIPLGKAEGDTDLSDVLGPQVPIIADIGGKLGENIFLGGYVGLHFGGTGGRVSDLCDQAKVDCIGVGVRIGAEIQYHISPGAKINPWFGYGIGYEAAGFSGEKNGNKLTATYGGVEFAHFMGGADFRLTKGFGIGPFVDFAIGQYTKAAAEVQLAGQPRREIDGDVQDTALHQWIMIGARVVIFP